MTTPTPRTDAIALDRNDSHRHPDCSDRIVGWTDYEALRDRSREIERDLAARDASLRYVRETLDKALPGMDEGAPIEAIARKVAAHIAAREAELAELMKWKEAVINELIVAHIYSQVHDDSPRKAVHDAITWNCQVALDPAVSSDAQRLRDTYLQRAEAAEARAEENARDAGRYRWLRGNPCLPFGVTRYRSEPVEYYAGDSLDASIDAAIAAKGEA